VTRPRETGHRACRERRRGRRAGEGAGDQVVDRHQERTGDDDPGEGEGEQGDGVHGAASDDVMTYLIC